jgi:hypothetical protein
VIRRSIHRNIDQLNRGDTSASLARFADNATLSFPGSNSWSNQHRATTASQEPSETHRGRPEIEAFLARYRDVGMQMAVDDILVNGPPWNMRAAVRVHHWVTKPEAVDRKTSRGVLFINAKWGKILSQENYEDTEWVAQYDALLERGA